MVCWPVDEGNEIYVDENFALNNKVLVDLQLQHEVLHALVHNVDGEQVFYGVSDYDDKANYIGIIEATTQMFTEDITNIRLDAKTNYLFFIENIMRVIESVIW